MKIKTIVYLMVVIFCVSAIVLMFSIPLLNRVYGVPLSLLTQDIQRANRLVLMEISVPPNAKPYDAPEEQTYIKKSTIQVTLSQTYEMDGSFKNVIEWYEKFLIPQGWKPYDPKEWRDFRVDFCLPPRILFIERDADYAEGHHPHHRFRLRLKWLNGFDNDNCPFSENKD